METKRGSPYFPPNYVTLKQLQERRLQEEEERRRRAAAAEEEEESRQRSHREGKKPPLAPQNLFPPVPDPAAEQTKPSAVERKLVENHEVENIRKPRISIRSFPLRKNSPAPALNPAAGDDRSTESPEEVKRRKQRRRKKKKNVGKNTFETETEAQEGRELVEDEPANVVAEVSLEKSSGWKGERQWPKGGRNVPVVRTVVPGGKVDQEDDDVVEKIGELKVSESDESTVEVVGGRAARLVAGRDGRRNSGSRGSGRFSSRGRSAAAREVWIQKTTSS